ncbi:hypothetical protein ABTF15_16390 [Acinetobacter baumannii]
MLFNNDDIGQLRYFIDIAETLNKIYMFFLDHPHYQLKLNNEPLDKEVFFYKLKDNCIYVDNIFKTVTSSDSEKFIHGALNELNEKLNSSYKEFLIDLNRVGLFFNSLVLIFYGLFYEVYENKFFPEPLNIKYNTSSYFKKYFYELKEWADKLLSVDSNYSFIDKYEKKFFILESKVNDLMEQNIKNTNVFNEKINQFIFEQKNIYDERVNKIISDFHNELSKIHSEFVISIKEDAEKLERSIKSTDVDFKATYEDYDTLKKMVNAKGEQEVTNYYKNKADWERFTYWFMTTLTFIIIGGAICLATLSLNDYKTKTSINIDEWSQKLKNQPIEKIEKIYELQQKNALIYLILRLVISIFLFSSIIYTSRIAYRAYIHMRHSENMRLKLATLRPFINHLDSNDKKQIHKDLIPDYFGKDAGLVDTANEKFKDLPANVSAVAMKAIEQISGSGSNSSTEKNGKKSDDETG